MAESFVAFMTNEVQIILGRGTSGWNILLGLFAASSADILPLVAGAMLRLDVASAHAKARSAGDHQKSPLDPAGPR
jgi:hypothetical protein